MFSLTQYPSASARTEAAAESSIAPSEIVAAKAERGQDLIYRSLLLLLCVALWVPRLQGPINFRWDASAYYILGTALAEGKGYRLLNEPGSVHAVQYPPLLPVLVAVVQRALGTHDYYKVGCALRFTYFFLSVLFLLMTYALARRFLPSLGAFLVGVITALSFSSFVGSSDVLYAEMPFAVVTTAFLLYHQSNCPVSGVLRGILAVAAYLLRTAGLALLFTWVAESLIRRRFGQAAVRVAVSAVPILLWQGYVWQVTHSDEYRHPAYSYQRAPYYYSNVTYGENSHLVDPFQPELGKMHAGDFGERLVRNIAVVPLALGESTIVPKWFVPSLVRQLQSLRLPLSRSWPRLISGVFYSALAAAGLLALVGAILVATGQNWFVSLYFGITVALIVLTPWQNQFWRYLAPMAPVTLTLILVGLLAIRHRLGHADVRWGRTAGTLVIAISIVAILLTQIAVVAHVFRSMGAVSYYDGVGHERVLKLVDYPSEWHSLDPAFEWLRRNAPSGAVVAATVPHLAYLRTDHKAVLPPLERDADTASRLLDEVPVTFLVLDSFERPGVSERYAAPLVAQKSQDWRLVFTAPDLVTRVYERTR